MPAGQGDAKLCPLCGTKVPGAACVHAVAPLEEEYEPAGHAVAVEAADVPTYVPGCAAKHCVWPRLG